MIILYATFLLFVIAFCASREQSKYLLDPARRRPLYTFIVDPPTFLIVGLVGTIVGMINCKGRKLTYKEFLTRKKIIDILLFVFVIGFWTMEALSYFNVMAHPFYPDRTGNDFMWNGYIDFLGWSVVDTAVPTFKSLGMNLLALLLLALQIPFLLLGRALGYNTAFFNDKFNWTKPKRK